MGLSRAQVYRFQFQIRQMFPLLGYWQELNLAIYSLGIILARHCAASRVAEKLPMLGKADSVQRRLERFLANPRLVIEACCQAWTKWVFEHAWQGQPIILLVDETKLGNRLSIMVVGVAYGRCCIPLAWWCYPPKAWPLKQVALIDELLRWVAVGLPAGVVPLVEVDRGLGTSPALIRAIEARGWHYLFRVQCSVKLTTFQGKTKALGHLVAPGEYWSGRGIVFKKRGKLIARVEVLWVKGYDEPWCLVTNLPARSGALYGVRYWQEASFRDLKSDGWQWQRSQVWTPAHADIQVLAMTVAYALTLGFGSQAQLDPDLRALVTKGSRPTYSLFRLGLRLWEQHAWRMITVSSYLKFPLAPLADWSSPADRPLCRVHDLAQLPWSVWFLLCFFVLPPP